MYLDIYEMMDKGVLVCRYDIAMCPGLDRIQIHAMITSDTTVLANKGEI